MSSGPLHAMVLAKPGAISHWRLLCGPTNSNTARVDAPDSIRAQFGLNGQRNAVHGSDSTKSANREISFFFPQLNKQGEQTVNEARGYLSSACAGPSSKRTLHSTLVEVRFHNAFQIFFFLMKCCT